MGPGTRLNLVNESLPMINELKSMTESRCIYIDRSDNIQSTRSRLYVICIKVHQCISCLFKYLSCNPKTFVTDKALVRQKVYEVLLTHKGSFQEKDFEQLQKLAVRTELISKDTVFPQKTLDPFFKACNSTLGVVDELPRQSEFKLPEGSLALVPIKNGERQRVKFNDRVNFNEYSLNKFNFKNLFEMFFSSNPISLDLQYVHPQRICPIVLDTHFQQIVPYTHDSEEISGGEIQSASKSVAYDQDIAQRIIPIASHFANLAYNFQVGTETYQYNNERYSVNYLNRTTGFNIETTAVIGFQSEKEVVFAVPGTEGPNDWVSNLYCATESIGQYLFFNRHTDDEIFSKNQNYTAHVGFLSVAESIIKSLIQKQNKQSGDKFLFSGKEKIVFTGHSQGGAVATLLSLYAETHRKYLGIPESCEIICVTFGSPRVFTKETAPFYEEKVKKTYRIVNPIDGVPLFPLGRSGFKHVGLKIAMGASLFGRLLINDASDNVYKSLRFDFSAISRIWNSIFYLKEAAILPHSMDYYSRLVHHLEGQSSSLNSILMGQLQLPLKLAIEAPLRPSVSFPRVTYTRGEDEDTDVLTFEKWR